MINSLTGALDFQSQALVMRSERQRLIASNIANADTPGYVARDFNFAQALREASGEGSALGGPITSDLLAEGFGATRAASTLRYAAPSQTNLDQNTVDMDRERAAFADNALKYESALRFITASVKTLQDAMKAPNQG